jgi:hypothetical protein
VKEKNITDIQMKNYIRIAAGLLLMVWVTVSCSDDFPVDEDGLLITARGQCYVSNFELLGSDFQTVRSKAPVIDTTAQTINVEVFYGTDLTNVYPQFSLVTDAKLDPKVPGKMDLSDLANPTQWTVISGNRKVRKTYTLYITVQP